MVGLPGPFRKKTALLSEFLGNCSDMIGLYAAAASDNPYAEVVRLPGPLGHLDPCNLTGLHCIRILWELDPAEVSTIRSPETKGLGHEVGTKTSSFKACLELSGTVQQTSRFLSGLFIFIFILNLTF